MSKKNASSEESAQKKSGFQIEPLYYLLVAIPVAVVLKFIQPDGTWIFLASAVAIIPLASLMGRATENLAETMGAGIGGLLNATFGNAAELIIALIALWKGQLELVKASITGSIIGNILLVLGLSILAGGFVKKKQVFNRTAAGMGATLMALACVGLLVPTFHYQLWYAGPHQIHVESRKVLEKEKLVKKKTAEQQQAEKKREQAEAAEQTRPVVYLSEEIAVILALVYLLSLVFSLKTHQHLFAGPEEDLPTTGEHHKPEWNRKTSIIVLLTATVGVAIMSEFLVVSVEHAAESLHMNKIFIGVIVVAVIGNAAEHSTAVLMAAKSKMDLSMNIAIGSSIQIALFVAPVLVFASLLMPNVPTLDLHFTSLEIIAVIISMLVVAMVAQDGECHWMEGVMLLAVYIVLALAFYHLPESAIEAMP